MIDAIKFDIMNNLLDQALLKIKNKVDEDCENGNIETSERVLSVVAGGFILGLGLKYLLKHPLTAFSGLSVGSALVYRGVTGKCAVKKALEEEPIEVIERRYFVKK